MSGNVRVLKGRKPQAKAERNKLICGGPHEDSSPGAFYRLIETDGILEAECMECFQDVDRKWYTPETVQAMIDEAVAKAKEAWEAGREQEASRP